MTTRRPRQVTGRGLLLCLVRMPSTFSPGLASAFRCDVPFRLPDHPFEYIARPGYEAHDRELPLLMFSGEAASGDDAVEEDSEAD